MYIGALKLGKEPKFYHANTNVPFEPQITADGYVWNMSSIYDSLVDICYTFDSEYYVGAVDLGLKGAKEVSLILDGVKVAVNDINDLAHVNLCSSELIIRAQGNVGDMKFTGAKIYGFKDDNAPLLFPFPKSEKFEERDVSIGKIEGVGADGEYAREFFKNSLAERLETPPEAEGTALTFKIDEGYESERYTISVNQDKAEVKAGSRLALLWGACRVIDLWDEAKLPVTEVDDHPDMPMRGFHMGLPRRDRIEFTKRFFRHVLLPLGYNRVFIEFNGAMRFDSHPKISEKWLESERLYEEGEGKRVMHADIGAEGTLLEKSEVKELISVLDEYGIEVIPEVQSLAHIEYITNAYPELAELGKTMGDMSDEELAQLPHSNITDHCYCPSDKKCYDIIYDIIDEIVEVVKPKRYVHIGHDEVYHLGLCPECKAKGAPRVYVEHVTALHDYLAKKGLGTMLWSDMLHTDMYYTGEAFDNVKRELPKDLVLLDFTWYYHFDKDIEDDVLPEGYKILMGNLYSSHYPRFAKRINKPGMLGGEVSTWTAVSEELFALNGKFFDLPYTAEMLWNAHTYDESNRAALTALIGHCIIPEMRDLLHGRYDLYTRSELTDTTIVGRFKGDPFRVPRELWHLGLVEPKTKMRVGKKYDRLFFDHATVNPAPRICWQGLVPVGKYTVVYKDGQKIDVPVDYAGGILALKSVYGEPKPQQYYRHQGYVGTWFADVTYEGRTYSGEPHLLLGQVWDNPHPDKKIAYITYTPDENDTAILVSAGIRGVRLK